MALNWLFDYFLPRSIVQIANRSAVATQYRRYAKGDVISWEGQLVDGFYTVTSGYLESQIRTAMKTSSASWVPVTIGVSAA